MLVGGSFSRHHARRVRDGALAGSDHILSTLGREAAAGDVGPLDKARPIVPRLKGAPLPQTSLHAYVIDAPVFLVTSDPAQPVPAVHVPGPSYIIHPTTASRHKFSDTPLVPPLSARLAKVQWPGKS